MAKSKPILIVGAGLAGCRMAVELARLGYRVKVYERRTEAEARAERRRSINLALSHSTLELLGESASLKRKLSAMATPLEGRVLHPLAGKPIFQPYAGRSSDATLLNPPAGAASVSRMELNALLRSEAAAHDNIEFRFGARVVSCDPQRASLRFETSRGRSFQESGECIIAADGAGSAVRQMLRRRKAGAIREDLKVLDHAYKELSFTPRRSLRKKALHVWPRPGFLLMALPNPDRSFRGAIFLPRHEFSRLKSGREILRFFAQHFSDAFPNLKDLYAQFSRNPVSSLVSVRCERWHVGRVVLIGDACHTLYPFSGQGANLALEDCVHLRRCIVEFAPDWARAFSAFTELRKAKVDYLCEATRAVTELLLNVLPEEGIAGRV